MAEAIVNRRPDPNLVERVAALGEKAQNGTLSGEEQSEYKDLVDAGDLISLLKLKARRYLEQNPR
jgi:hypothetical protein